MAHVTDAERDAMARMMAIMNGETPPPAVGYGNSKQVNEAIEISGPGVITQGEINAMANVLEKLNKVTHQVMLESNGDVETKMDIMTSRTAKTVNVGGYKIGILTNERRIAGKQYYCIEHAASGTVIADDITLYEVALGVVKLLNDNKFVNDPRVNKLFEVDSRYTSHRVDAMSAKIRHRKAERAGDMIKEDIYATKYQKALDQAMNTKSELKRILINGS
jgi:uncharacterized protein (UPF0332 family)